MVVVNLCGGIGNQMFQYCLGRYLSILTKQDLFLNITIYQTGISNRNFDLDIFTLGNPKIGNTEEAFKAIEGSGKEALHIYEKKFEFDHQIIDSLKSLLAKHSCFDFPHLVISGYWQSEKYFMKIGDIIKKDFLFLTPLSGRWLALNEQIMQANSVMINVRRGDYLQKLDYHGVIDIDYIRTAIDLIKMKTTNPYFYVFSDDIGWCEKHILEEKNLFFVDSQFYDPKYQFYLQLMTNCKHFIIANSTFAWWAAWLATHKEKIVISPKKWFAKTAINTADLIPSQWIKV